MYTSWHPILPPFQYCQPSYLLSSAVLPPTINLPSVAAQPASAPSLPQAASFSWTCYCLPYWGRFRIVCRSPVISAHISGDPARQRRRQTWMRASADVRCRQRHDEASSHTAAYISCSTGCEVATGGRLSAGWAGWLMQRVVIGESVDGFVSWRYVM